MGGQKGAGVSGFARVFFTLQLAVDIYRSEITRCLRCRGQSIVSKVSDQLETRLLQINQYQRDNTNVILPQEHIDIV